MLKEKGGRYLLIRVVRLCMPWPVLLARSWDMFRFRSHETRLRVCGNAVSLTQMHVTVDLMLLSLSDARLLVAVAGTAGQ